MIKISDFKKIISKILVLGLFLDHDAADGVLNPEEVCVLSEELKWASRTASVTVSGRQREVDPSSSGVRTQPDSSQCGEDVLESLPVCSSLPPPSGQLLNNEDKTEIDENQSARPHRGPSYQIQPSGKVGWLQGGTPVKLCRRELRQISTSELSLRRSGLGGRLGAVTADSIQVPFHSSTRET